MEMEIEMEMQIEMEMEMEMEVEMELELEIEMDLPLDVALSRLHPAVSSLPSLPLPSFLLLHHLLLLHFTFSLLYRVLVECSRAMSADLLDLLGGDVPASLSSSSAPAPAPAPSTPVAQRAAPPAAAPTPATATPRRRLDSTQVAKRLSSQYYRKYHLLIE